MKKGYVQVYTGNGKGKTTAAFGLAMRAAGAGLKVFIAQFIKKRKCSEHTAVERFKGIITVQQYGKGFILGKKPSAVHIRAAHEGFRKAEQAVLSGEYDLVVLDELNIAVHYGLVPVQAVLDLIANKPKAVELVITGRYADEKVMRAADLVTEMREIKHYREKGIEARKKKKK